MLAPQGLGVTEVSLVALLSSSNDDTGIALAVLFGGYRLAQVVRDLMTAAAAEVLAKRHVRREAKKPE